jgi:streptogramin lyase
VGPIGALWFTSQDQTGRITITGTITGYPTPGAEFLNGMASGPDGALWFVVSTPAQIGRAPVWGFRSGLSRHHTDHGLRPGDRYAVYS